MHGELKPIVVDQSRGCSQDVSTRGHGKATYINYRTNVNTAGRIGRRHESSVLEVDPKRYGRLLARKLPAVIRTEEENERLIAELEQLDRRHDELTPEEREYAELLTVLIESFEDANYELEGSTPHSRLRSLMEEHGRCQ